MTTVNLGPTIAVSNVLNNKGVVQITFSRPHGLVTGQTVSVANVIGVPGATGQFTVTVLNSTNFLLNGTIYTGVLHDGNGDDHSWVPVVPERRDQPTAPRCFWAYPVPSTRFLSPPTSWWS